MTLLLLGLSRIDLYRTVELRTLDARLRHAGGGRTSSAVAIVFIGDDSIEAFGRWPWSWEYHSLLVDALVRAGAKRVLFDILFMERPGDRSEELFAGTVGLAKNVYFGTYFQELADGPSGASSPFPLGRSLQSPVEELCRSAAGRGHLNIQPDVDGSLRRVPLMIGHDGGFYPAATLVVAADTLGVAREALAPTPAGDGIELRGADGRAVVVPVGADGQTLVNYIGGLETFPSYSFRQVLEADRHPERAAVDLAGLKDKIVLVGATFAGSADLRPTPFSKSYPMTAVQATVLENLLSGEFIRTPSRGAFLALWILGSALIGAATFLFPPLASFVVSAAAAGGYLAVSLVAFHAHRWNLELVGPLVSVAVTYSLVTAARHVAADREARTIRRMFSSYMTERVVRELIDHPELAALGGQRREVTVLFADIKDFTPFSEKHSAEEVVARLNEFLGAMTEVIIRWEGTLDKFVGDAIVAFWGAPLLQGDHAERALRCSLHMIMTLEQLEARWRQAGKDPFEIGIGINSGEVIVGNIGSEGRKMDYTVIGDAVNAAARLVSLTRKHGCQILITGATLARVQGLVRSGKLGHLAVRHLEKALVKGKEEPIEVYELHAAPASGAPAPRPGACAPPAPLDGGPGSLFNSAACTSPRDSGR